jgi:hypothetical protein
MLFAIATFALCLLLILGFYWAFVVRPEEQQTRSVTDRLKGMKMPGSATIGVTTSTTRLSSVPDSSKPT